MRETGRPPLRTSSMAARFGFIPAVVEAVLLVVVVVLWAVSVVVGFGIHDGGWPAARAKDPR